MVLAPGKEEVTEEVVTGFAVVQERVTLQVLFPEAIVQEGTERLPDIVWEDSQMLPFQLPEAQEASAAADARDTPAL